MVMDIYKMHFIEIIIESKAYNYYFDNLIKAKKLKTKNILINKKNYKDLDIYFARYYHGKSIKMLNLFYHDLVGKIEKRNGKEVFA